MNDLSLHILDAAQNSIAAGAENIVVSVCDGEGGARRIEVRDDGCGMSAEMLACVTSPFATSRESRRVGLGVPLFKLAAELTGGSLRVESEQGKGTRLTAVWITGHIDCPPLGDMGETMALLIGQNPGIRFVYRRRAAQGAFTLDTDALRQELGSVPLGRFEVQRFIREFVNDNEKELVEVHQ